MPSFNGVLIASFLDQDVYQYDTSGADPQPSGVNSSFVDPTMVERTHLIAYPQGFALQGVLADGFGQVWFDTIHVFPALYNDLGNVVPGQSYEFEVWNGYDIPYTMNSRTVDGTGLDLTTDHSVPTLFNPLESKTYVLTVAENGPLAIDQTYTLTFDNETVAVTFVAIRAIVFTFPPNWGKGRGVRERVEWLTDVIEARNGTEQTIKLRHAPRRTFSYETLVQGVSVRELNKVLHNWQGRPFAVPVWTDYDVVAGTDLAIGATTMAADTTGKDYYNGCLAMLWQGWDVYETVTIDSFDGTSVTFAAPTNLAHPRGTLLLPLRTSRLASVIRASRLNANVTIAELVFTIDDMDHPWVADNGPVTYLGHAVLLEEPNQVNDLEHSYSRKIEVVDAGTNRPFYDELSQTPQLVTAFEWLLQRYPAIGTLRAWFQARAGRWSPAWVPSWTVDLIIAETLTAGGSDLHTIDSQYRTFYKELEGRRDLMILMNDGRYSLHRITDAFLHDDNHEVIQIDPPAPYDINPQSVRIVCFLGLCRMATDVCEWEWPAPGVAQVRTNFRLLKE